MKPNATTFCRLLRPALLLGAALGVAFGPLPGASAQATGPQPNSPGVPTPYQSPVFHSGGAEDPIQGTGPADLPVFEGRLQGTPTTIVDVGGIPTPVQVPSYLLGAYNPLRPPAGPGVYYPDHFADGSYYSWQAPFDYVATAAITATQPPVDDNAGTPAFTLNPATGSWEQQTTGQAAGTAINQEYYRLPPNVNNASATWVLNVTSGGSLSVYLHIPDNIADDQGNIEPRSSTVTYVITTTGANATRTTATVSQTEANSSQFLAGPFQLAVGDTVTVTLARNNSYNRGTLQTNTQTGAYLIADQMLLLPTIGDVQSTPTAVNNTAFPTDFHGFKYWGIYVTALNGTPPVPTTTLTGQAAFSQNAPPDNTNGLTGTGLGGTTGTPLYHYGDPNKVTDAQGNLVGNGPKARLIRQVVYFGRSEPTAVSTTTVDNSQPRFNSVGGGTTINDASATQGNAAISNYFRYPASAGPGNTVAIWTLTAPANGSYFATIHIPGNVVRNPGRTALPDVRIADAHYVVSYVSGGTTVTRPATLSQTAGGDYTLSTGAIPLLTNQTATVTLYNGTQSTTNGAVVIADSVMLTTGSQKGAIYCVDGFNGEVIWRFETPDSTRGPSAAVFSSPAVKHIHVLTGSTTDPNTGVVTPTYADKLVVIVGDNNGLVYCLDAVGNGDGTSNANVIDPNTGQPILLPQPVYGSTPPVQVDAANYTPHVGTTQAYWIYRPDANLPKRLAQAATVPAEAPASVPVGAVRRIPAPTGGITGAAIHLYDRDLPIPGAFGTASPNVFVDPTITDVTKNNAVVYLPNSNGVVYALDALGNAVAAADPALGNNIDEPLGTGDRFYNSLDLTASEGNVPTATTRWWFTLRGVAGASGTGDSAAAFTSAPALYVNSATVPATPGPPAMPAVTTHLPSVYVGSSSEEGDSSNVGRVYALDGLAGPSGNGGKTAASLAAPGTPNYNLSQRPQTAAGDQFHWSFPDAYGTEFAGVATAGVGKSSNKLPRPALGDVTGSPVVFTNYNRGVNGTVGENTPARRTRIYFAANSGLEIAPGSTDTVAAARPDNTTTGRVWAVNLDGSVGRTTNTAPVAGISSNTWAYPLANDPNQAKFDTFPEPQLPMGSFLNATPAIGFVQFPAFITFTGGIYAPADTVHTGGLLSQYVPMLYVGTRGATDTALYALDIDGDGTQGPPNANGVTTGKLIYRQPSPDGTIFQSSPALVTNSSATGGNGGAVYVVSGNTLYDFSATPISNPITTEAFPLVRENAAITGAGPISSPTVSAADVSDLTATAQFNGLYGGANVTDWVYFGDSSTGFCRGITPKDSTYGGIPGELDGIVPPSVSPPGAVDLSAIPQVYLVTDANAGSRNAAPGADAIKVGAGESLPVYEWGQNVYIRIKNIVPPGTTHYVVDTSVTAQPGQAITAYSNGGAITFQLSDSAPGSVADSATIPAVLLPNPADATQPLANGFYIRADTPAASTPAEQSTNLVDATTANQRYIAAYTYHIGDGSERLNTPGSQRRVLNVKQTVHVFTSTDGIHFTDNGTTVVLSGTVTNGNLVSRPTTDANGKPTYVFDQVLPVDQPTLGILNPLGVQGGGLPLPLTMPYNQAYQIGDPLGPFRGIVSPMPANASAFDLEALANGNTVPLVAPASTSGAGTSPIVRPAGDLSTTTPNTRTHVVVTSTPLIPHNGSGDNSDPTGDTAPPRGTGKTGSGLLTTNFGTVDQPYALDFFDRSALGLAGQTLQIRMSATPNGGAGGGLAWVDNTVLTPQGNTTGHDSVVNYLPWETAPLGVRAGPNTSADYPNIPAGNVTATLYSAAGSADLGAGRATPKPATPGGTGANSDPVLNRTVYGNPVQVHVTIPNHQPANQQVYVDAIDRNGNVYYNAFGETVPAGLNNLNSTQRAYPMGYSSTRRVYVPNTAGRYREGAAFRTIRIYTGVPVDMRTSIVSPTTDVGRIPSALGVQTDMFSPLGLFAPVNRNFDSFFQPVTVHNDGNVNLLNVHLDQKEYYQAASESKPGPHTLRLNSDSLDPLSYILGYDDTGLTGPRANLPSAVPGGVIQQPYLVRSSLDTDLVDAYGRNPAIVGDVNLNVLYPGATFHKALPGSDNPTTLTVPDSPEDTSTGYSLPAASDNRPLVNANGVPQVAASPYVSLAVPFGTPVGTYSQTVRVFEGLDTYGYQTYNPASTNYNPLYPPQYGRQAGGIRPPGRSPDPVPSDVYQYGLQPVSTTGTVVKGSVVEDRMTDGFTFGALPQIDLGPAGPSVTGNNGTTTQSVPNLGPAAFRDPTNGNMALYWTSNRNGSFGISGRAVPFQQAANANASGYFLPYNNTTSWWGNADVSAVTGIAGVNSGLTIAQDPSNTTSALAFFVNVQPNPNRYTLYAATIQYTAATGSIGKITNPIAITNDLSQVKYGVKGLVTGNTKLAFWTASTRGRTAIYYTANFTGTPTPATTFVLPVPAGLTAVSDPNPVLMPTASGSSQVEVTFSGTASDGSVDLYNCRYLIDSNNPGKLNLAPFVAVREIMAPVGGGYQSRDVAWDRTGQLNLFAIDTTTGTEYPLLYKTVGGVLTPQFKRAIVDKASGQLVLTSVPLPGAQSGTLTVYLDGASGRVRFAPALPPTFRIEALFVPQAKRITGTGSDRRADTGPVTFLDRALKPNDSPNLNPLAADRRWYLWRKSGAGQGGAATLFYKTQRLTAYLPFPVDTNKPLMIKLNGADYTGPVDVLNVTGGPVSARLYFPIDSGAEGKAITYSYTGTDANGTSRSGPLAGTTDTVQWQDERRTSDTSVPPANATEALQSAEGYAVPIDKTVNENNVAAFLDPDANKNFYRDATTNDLTHSHKVWLFWNSTRNGTSDLYMETIDPRFGP